MGAWDLVRLHMSGYNVPTEYRVPMANPSVSDRLGYWISNPPRVAFICNSGQGATKGSTQKTGLWKITGLGIGRKRMQRRKPDEADIIIDDHAFSVDSLQELAFLCPLRRYKGIEFKDYGGLRRRLEDEDIAAWNAERESSVCESV
jgi:hypothetical protein